MMLGILAITAKDLRLVLTRSNALLQALLLGLLLIFLFSLSQGGTGYVTPDAAATIFWMATAFCQTLIFNTLYSLEENNGQRFGLLLAPIPSQAIWLGKAVAGLLLLLILQLSFFIAAVIFLGQTPGGQWTTALLAMLLADAGIAAAGSLLGAVAQEQASRETLYSIVLFPLLLPLFLAGIRTLRLGFATDSLVDVTAWIGLIAAFDAIFLAAGLILFPYIYGATTHDRELP